MRRFSLIGSLLVFLISDLMSAGSPVASAQATSLEPPVQADGASVPKQQAAPAKDSASTQ